MIEIIVSDSCVHCDEQVDVMKRAFFADEYCIIKVDSSEFSTFDMKDSIDAVPFVVVRDGMDVRYARPGVIDGTSLRKLSRGKDSSAPFNLRRSRLKA